LNGASFIIINCPNPELVIKQGKKAVTRPIEKEESQFAVEALKTYGDSSLRYE